MVFVLGVAAAAFLGVGWVLQQRVATEVPSERPFSWEVLRRLIATRVWWAGIAAMAVGQSLAAWGLQVGPVTLVEPLLVTCLLFAFGFAAWRGRGRVTPLEIVGTLVVAGGVTLFLAVGEPTVKLGAPPGWQDVTVATVAVAAAAAAIVVIGAVSPSAAATAGATAAAAATFYALQDVATRGAIVVVSHHGLAAVARTIWPYILLGAAVVGVLLSQAAFREARLDWSLPPTAAAQPVAGVALGLGLLGDHLSADPSSLAVEVLSLLMTVGGVLIVGRSDALRDTPARTRHPQSVAPAPKGDEVVAGETGRASD